MGQSSLSRYQTISSSDTVMRPAKPASEGSSRLRRADADVAALVVDVDVDPRVVVLDGFDDGIGEGGVHAAYHRSDHLHVR